MYNVAITGASGMLYADRLLRFLVQKQIPVNLMVSEPAWSVLRQELVWSVLPPSQRQQWVNQCYGANIKLYANNDWSAPAASGSAQFAGLVILPCSMGTLGRIAAGVSTSLIERCADVCLKERRKLILVVREMPLSLIHLENMTKLAQAGAVIMPASPGFYHNPTTVEDLVDFVVGRVLTVMGIENPLVQQWGATIE